mmetsp:Transcript_39320/g.121576  ORF Transcript_39320/g.121576 Transcript_39320/m.121576 type:complete len:597 (+) Transcript_39320:1271-3061(+)
MYSAATVADVHGPKRSNRKTERNGKGKHRDTHTQGCPRRCPPLCLRASSTLGSTHHVHVDDGDLTLGGGGGGRSAALGEQVETNERLQHRYRGLGRVAVFTRRRRYRLGGWQGAGGRVGDVRGLCRFHHRCRRCLRRGGLLDRRSVGRRRRGRGGTGRHGALRDRIRNTQPLAAQDAAAQALDRGGGVAAVAEVDETKAAVVAGVGLLDDAGNLDVPERLEEGAQLVARHVYGDVVNDELPRPGLRVAGRRRRHDELASRRAPRAATGATRRAARLRRWLLLLLLRWLLLADHVLRLRLRGHLRDLHELLLVERRHRHRHEAGVRQRVVLRHRHGGVAHHRHHRGRHGARVLGRREAPVCRHRQRAGGRAGQRNERVRARSGSGGRPGGWHHGCLGRVCCRLLLRLLRDVRRCTPSVGGGTRVHLLAGCFAGKCRGVVSATCERAGGVMSAGKKRKEMKPAGVVWHPESAFSVCGRLRAKGNLRVSLPGGVTVEAHGKRRRSCVCTCGRFPHRMSQVKSTQGSPGKGWRKGRNASRNETKAARPDLPSTFLQTADWEKQQGQVGGPRDIAANASILQTGDKRLGFKRRVSRGNSNK